MPSAVAVSLQLVCYISAAGDAPLQLVMHLCSWCCIFAAGAASLQVCLQLLYSISAAGAASLQLAHPRPHENSPKGKPWQLELHLCSRCFIHSGQRGWTLAASLQLVLLHLCSQYCCLSAAIAASLYSVLHLYSWRCITTLHRTPR